MNVMETEHLILQVLGSLALKLSQASAPWTEG